MKPEIQDNLEIICDYLNQETRNSKEDCERRGVLYKLFELPYNEKKATCPFLPGPLGEAIVSLYYKILKIPYQEKPKSFLGSESKRVNPDGLENDQFYVEVKMRSYHSSGTAHEKIPSIPWKYSMADKKLKIFLLADDEHKYNIFWTKLMRGEVKPRNSFEKKLLETNSHILENVVLGTEVSEVFASAFRNTQ